MIKKHTFHFSPSQWFLFNQILIMVLSHIYWLVICFHNNLQLMKVCIPAGLHQTKCQTTDITINLLLTVIYGCLVKLASSQLPFRVYMASLGINPLTPVSDQDRISPYYIYTISHRQVMRIKKNINYGITNWFNTKFSKLV